MFKSKKSIKIKKPDSEAIAINEETENNQNLIDDTTTTSDERIYMNLPRQTSEDEPFYSPTVKVKHSINYEYDEKKFEIFKGEYLYLINKTNHDWWLCLRLDENLTFFVPASYLDEIEANKTPRPSLVAPPRPPPPPPKPSANLDRQSNIYQENTSIKPEVKQRNLVNADKNVERKGAFEFERAADAVINDLDQRLDKEERSLSRKSKIEDNQIYQNVNESSQKIDTNVNNEEIFEEEDEDDDYEEEDEQDIEKMQILEKLQVPAGWKICMSGCKRHVFYNEINHEIWYVNYDSNGKHYFYNKEGVSIWQLKELNVKDDEVKESSTHFQKRFDEELETFNNLFSRLSVRQHSNEASASFTTLNDSLSEMTKTSKSKSSDSSNVTSVSNSNKVSVPNELFRCVRIIENGKKHKKKTIEDLRVYLANPKLLFVKTQKGGMEKLEFSVDVKGAKCYGIESLRNNSLVNIKDKNNNQSTSKTSSKSSSKRDKETEELFDLIGNSKSAFVIETLNGFKILLISESVNIINDWVSVLNSIIYQITDSFDSGFSNQISEQEPVAKYEQQKSRMNSSKKECIFGSNLINLCRKENTLVPLFVVEIISSIEYKGLDVDGIYRISGNLAEVQKVRIQVDQGKGNFKDFDIHVLCGALKTFFRELEEPLIPFSLHQDFLNSINIADKQKRFEKIRVLIKTMPMAHRETLVCLCKHLLKVIDQSSHNRMNIQNIALVFGPNIMRSNPINDANNGFNPNIMTQNVLVEYILTNFKDLFNS